LYIRLPDVYHGLVKELSSFDVGGQGAALDLGLTVN